MQLPHPWKQFRANPWSIRWATTALISVTASLVVSGALAIRVFDPDEYPTFGDALWFTLQTITTVGYGDSTPATGVGRTVAAIVMLVSIGLVTVITAVITSILIEAARGRRPQSKTDETIACLARIEATLAATNERLGRIEQGALRRGPGSEDVR